MRGFFEELVYSKRRKRNPLFLPVSAAVHALVVGAFGWASVFGPPTLPVEVPPKARPIILGAVVRADTERPQPPPRGPAARPVSRPHAQPFEAPAKEPTTIPVVDREPETDLPQGWCAGCPVGPPGPATTESGRPGGDGTGPVGTSPTVVRVGTVRPPRKLKDVKPQYPPLAAAGHLDGVVVLECTIGTDGRVSSITVLQGKPILQEAAIDAVRQWVYTPTLLDGVPVSVIMDVTVRFTFPR